MVYGTFMVNGLSMFIMFYIFFRMKPIDLPDLKSCSSHRFHPKHRPPAGLSSAAAREMPKCLATAASSASRPSSASTERRMIRGAATCPATRRSTTLATSPLLASSTPRSKSPQRAPVMPTVNGNFPFWATEYCFNRLSDKALESTWQSTLESALESFGLGGWLEDFGGLLDVFASVATLRSDGFAAALRFMGTVLEQSWLSTTLSNVCTCLWSRTSGHKGAKAYTPDEHMRKHCQTMVKPFVKHTSATRLLGHFADLHRSISARVRPASIKETRRHTSYLTRRFDQSWLKKKSNCFDLFWMDLATGLAGRQKFLKLAPAAKHISFKKNKFRFLGKHNTMLHQTNFLKRSPCITQFHMPSTEQPPIFSQLCGTSAAVATGLSALDCEPGSIFHVKEKKPNPKGMASHHHITYSSRFPKPQRRGPQTSVVSKERNTWQTGKKNTWVPLSTWGRFADPPRASRCCTTEPLTRWQVAAHLNELLTAVEPFQVWNVQKPQQLMGTTYYDILWLHSIPQCSAHEQFFSTPHDPYRNVHILIFILTKNDMCFLDRVRTCTLLQEMHSFLWAWAHLHCSLHFTPPMIKGR